MAGAWLVTLPDGREARFDDHTRALNYAAKVHGLIAPLKECRDENQARPADAAQPAGNFPAK